MFLYPFLSFDTSNALLVLYHLYMCYMIHLEVWSFMLWINLSNLFVSTSLIFIPSCAFCSSGWPTDSVWNAGQAGVHSDQHHHRLRGDDGGWTWWALTSFINNYHLIPLKKIILNWVQPVNLLDKEVKELL